MIRLPLASALLLTIPLAAQAPILGIWDFDESSGMTAADSGPFANTGTLNGFTNDPAQWVPGMRGNALSFDGVDDHVVFATNGGLSFYDGLGATFSVCFWVQGQPTDDDRVLSLGSSGSNTPLWTLGTGANSLGNADRLRIYIRNAEGVSSARYSDAVVFDGTWHHVAYVETSGRARLYVDGILDTANMDDRYYARGSRGAAHGTYPLDIVALGGVIRPSNCCYYSGAVDELRVYGFALDAADVQTVVQGGHPTACRASLGEYGTGCGAGPMELHAAGVPKVGGPAMQFYALHGTPNAPLFLNIGAGRITPLDLGGVGLPGCTMHAPTGTLLGVGALDAIGASGPVPLAIPNVSSLACLPISFQAVALGAGSAELSNSLVGLLGN
jgi:hypothetical protein